MDTSSDQPTIMTPACNTVEWYRPTLDQLPAPTVELFLQYTGLKSENEVKDHIYKIRDKAWQIISLSPIYTQVVDRVRKGQTLLDLGCCFGQDLRKLAFDAELSSATNLIGADIEGDFVQLGYELFRDEDSFGAQFVTRSVFDEDFLVDRRGSIDMIYLGNFLHLFGFKEQRAIVARLGRLLVPRAGSVVFGRNISAEQGGPFFMESLGWDMYRHSDQTIKELWSTVDVGLWEVHSQLSGYETATTLGERSGDWQGGDTKQMSFWVVRTDG
ncbi:hypothetical protein N7537_003779 [Penicillium hordei]|uniref:Methyltransferase domain-containing protein n=1 Tax=Penicillium hordei TaxID=40994 RepID=A0AAD6E9Y9_9EURO|nr:uncharacterized protein N7537_003779 [Penicillium hordei]KAJ5607160.1 hypothetical protein N7537_003779 [Penicillium hordei]